MNQFFYSMALVLKVFTFLTYLIIIYSFNINKLLYLRSYIIPYFLVLYLKVLTDWLKNHFILDIYAIMFFYFILFKNRGSVLQKRIYATFIRISHFINKLFLFFFHWIYSLFLLQLFINLITLYKIRLIIQQFISKINDGLIFTLNLLHLKLLQLLKLFFFIFQIFNFQLV